MSSVLGLETIAESSFNKSFPSHVSGTRRKIIIQPRKNSRLVFLTEQEGLAVEQYKLLRRRLRTLHPAGGVILMTSPSPGEGKTLTSVNLSFCLSEGHERTCLVDLDFRAPGVSPTIGYRFEEDGIDDILNGESKLTESLRQVGDRSLYTIGVRKSISSPGHLLSPTLLTPVLNQLRSMFHWVILDFAPVIPMADVAEVVPQVDGALLVVRTQKTEKSLITPCLETLGTKLWGIVMNDTQIRGSSYYGYYGKRRE
jgi:capsular exopolysaccharide synthesis family protein